MKNPRFNWRHVFGLLSERRRAARARRQLRAMPDSMLKDIGISRSDIDRVATDGKEFDTFWI